MKVMKYAIIDTRSNSILEYLQTKIKAERMATSFRRSGWEVKVRPIEIDLYCESCDKDLTENDEYLKVNEYTRYCSDCFEEERFTYYTVDGETVSDENGGGIHEKGETLD